jgi:hypothetical protein
MDAELKQENFMVIEKDKQSEYSDMLAPGCVLNQCDNYKNCYHLNIDLIKFVDRKDKY